MLLAACEVSGTLAAYELNGPAEINHRFETEIVPAQLNKDGKTKKPTVILKDKNGKAISTENYTVAYQANKSVGKATVIVTLKGNYSGRIIKSFTIIPKGSSIYKITGKKKSISVKWKKQSTYL